LTYAAFSSRLEWCRNVGVVWVSPRGLQVLVRPEGDPAAVRVDREADATAIVERLIRSIKEEWLRSTRVPFRRHDVRLHIALYVSWFLESRPHQGLGGRTPNEIYRGGTPANTKLRIEPRPRWPRGSPCADQRRG